MSTVGNAQRLPIASDGSFSGKPEVTLEEDEGFGLLGGLDAVNDQVAVAGTVNKDGGKPVSSDDRAFVIAVTRLRRLGRPGLKANHRHVRDDAGFRQGRSAPHESPFRPSSLERVVHRSC